MGFVSAAQRKAVWAKRNEEGEKGPKKLGFIQPPSPLECWAGYERVPGTSEFSKGSCRKKGSGPAKKQKGGGTTKTCLPAAKIKSMSKEQRKKGATLRDWFEKEDWRQVNDPSKKCGEK